MPDVRVLQVVAHLAGVVADTAIPRPADTELAAGLAGAVAAPALDPAVVEQHAGEVLADPHGDRTMTGSEIDRRQRIAELTRLVAALVGVRRGWNTDAPERVSALTKTAHAPVIEQNAGVIFA